VAKRESAGEWLAQPPAGALWVVEDSLRQLSDSGVPIGRRRGKGNAGLLAQAKAVYENEALWHHAPRNVGGMDRETFRRNLGGVLNSCRGFN